MPLPITNKRLEQLVWVLVYGGLLLAVFGVATRSADSALGHTCIALGALSAVAGAVLIYVRSRRRNEP